MQELGNFATFGDNRCAKPMPEIDDEKWMWQAIHFAREAAKKHEVPVGAVIVGSDGKVIASAGNRTIKNNDPTAHAEILALRTAAARTGNYRLTGATVYSTIEPCAMCAGALVNARIARLVYGADDERFGAVRTHFRICDNPKLNHRLEVVPNILTGPCRRLMQDFFRERRKSEPPAAAGGQPVGRNGR